MKQHRIAFRAVLSQLRPLNFLLLLAAGIVNAVGVTMFLAPVQLYDSGISGTSMLLWQVTPEEYTLSLFLLLLNIPLWTSPPPLPSPGRTCCCAPCSAALSPASAAA